MNIKHIFSNNQNNAQVETLDCSVNQLGCNGRGYWSEIVAEILSASTNIHPHHVTSHHEDHENMSKNDIKFLGWKFLKDCFKFKMNRIYMY